MTDCLFCKIVDGKIPSTKVHEDDRSIAFRDLNPQAPTHVLVIPKQHIATLHELTEADAPLIGHLHLVAGRLAESEGIAAGGYRVLFNTGRNAGQSVFHIHLHLLGGRPMAWPPG